MENFDDLIKDQVEYKNIRGEKYRSDSKERLAKILKKKVQTTMIGALSSVEENFGFLWDSKGEMSEQQKLMHDLYQKIRSEILDKGNTQARNIDAELSQYEVKWLRYSVNIPVKENKSED